MSSRFDGDQRMVGHAIRRRAGLPSSHLAMSEPRFGGRAPVANSNLKGVPSDYPTGSGSTGRGSSARSLLSSDNAAFVAGVQSVIHPELHPPRERLSQGESASARLTVSPSMKIPTVSPGPTQGAGRVVPSRPGRSRDTFDAGAAEERGH